MTVFDRVFPFFGTTLTVTLHFPFLIPLTVVPLTLQNFDELPTTFSLTFEPLGIASPENTAIDLAVAPRLFEMTGATWDLDPPTEELIEMGAVVEVV